MAHIYPLCFIAKAVGLFSDWRDIFVRVASRASCVARCRTHESSAGGIALKMLLQLLFGSIPLLWTT